MPLVDAIAAAVAYVDAPPPNEAATCLWIIYPLLQSMGYAPQEIHPQGSDNNGQYPDYTLLPNLPECWYLEAKAWNVSLQDSHVYQALNYANHNGKRWVVLTNGRIWRLYDNHVLGIPTDKLVTEIQLQNGLEAQEFLEALSRAAYLSGRLDSYSRSARLSRILRTQLFDEDGMAFKALWNVLKKEPGLVSLSRSELLTGLELLAGKSSHHVAKGQPKPKPPSPTLSLNDADSVALCHLASTEITGNKPVGLVFPDGGQKPISSWRALAVEVVSWLGNQSKCPSLPFQGGHGGKRHFIHSTPDHQHGPMAAHATIVMGGKTVYLDLHRSGIDLVNHTCDACKALDVDPSSIKVTLAKV